MHDAVLLNANLARCARVGAWITPGLIDCHTHLVYAGNRAHEFELRLKGATYEEIARSGGGMSYSILQKDGFDTGERRAQPSSKSSPATGSIATPSSRCCTSPAVFPD